MGAYPFEAFHTSLGSTLYIVRIQMWFDSCIGCLVSGKKCFSNNSLTEAARDLRFSPFERRISEAANQTESDRLAIVQSNNVF